MRSVRFLTSLILFLDYKDPLINRERRVKELFKSFEEDGEDEGEDDVEDDIDEDETTEKSPFSKDKSG